jgi:hypothetical protein
VHRGRVTLALREENQSEPVRDADARLPGRIRENKWPIEASSYR